MKPACLILCSLLAAAPAVPALAQQPAPTAVASAPAATLSRAEREAAVQAVIAAIEARYVFPDRVPAIRERLTDSLAAGRYDTPDAAAFAERLSGDLRDSSGDGHVYLRHAPDEYRALIGSTVAAEQTPEFMAIWAEAARRSNHGLSETRILPGNIRYLKVGAFHWVADTTGQAYDDAMRFLREGDAVILDLRGNGGGDHAAVRYLLSHFMKPDQLDITFLEAGHEPIQSRTLDHLPAGRLMSKPLYVLIDGGVGSAGEAFAYDVRQFHLGTLVGATTAGAANNNTFLPIAPGFALSVSYGRPVHPVTGTNWEGVGVEPDVATDPGAALDRASALALAALLQRTDAPANDRAAWEWARMAAEARQAPPRIDADRLAALAGAYGGRQILFEDGQLIWRRASGQRVVLRPLTADGLFQPEGLEDRMRMRLTGDALEIIAIDNPAPRRFARD